MLDPVENFAIEHLVVLLAGSVTMIAGIALRSYGRRHERLTRARGRRIIN
ncbi:MAG: hypothetical protein ACRYG4_09950 [Janthinobacterium lividum]